MAGNVGQSTSQMKRREGTEMGFNKKMLRVPWIDRE